MRPQGVMSVDLRYDGSGVQASAPKLVLPPHLETFSVFDSRHSVAVTADGQRFLLRQPRGRPGPPVEVILNWTEALPR